MPATRRPQLNFWRQATKPMRTVASGSGPGRPLLCLQHFTGTLDNSGILRSPTLLRLGERSLCSRVQVWDGRQARCLRRLPGWRSMHWRSWTGLRLVSRRRSWLLTRRHGRAADGTGPTVRFSSDNLSWHRTPRWRTSCTSISRASQNISVIPRFEDTQSCRKSSLLRRNRAKKGRCCFYPKTDPTHRGSRACLRTGCRPSSVGGLSRLGEVYR